jgi:hypothetical protein
MPNPASLTLPNAQFFMLRGALAIDQVTGLHWQRDFNGKATQAEAVAACEELKLEGFDDFRLPARIELVSLVDFTTSPSIDAASFPATPADYFWTQTLLPFDNRRAFSVYFGSGETGYGAANGPTAFSRCVRGGRPQLPGTYDTQPEEALDRNTGLQWQRKPAGIPMTWDEAMTYCSALPDAALVGWRLPSMKEAQTLIVEDVREGALSLVDQAVFHIGDQVRLWTSTQPRQAASSGCFYLNTADGGVEQADCASLYHALCVR